MNQSAWDEIEILYPKVDKKVVAQFKELKKQNVHTKGEGALRHYCSFFLPYDKDKKMIYLGHHKKADDWIPPGGHIEPGETPSDTAVREMYEELNVKINKSQLESFALSVKEIGRAEQRCEAHYDIWHLVHLPAGRQVSLPNFDYLKKEYYDARWFTIPDGLAHITKNPDFSNLLTLYFLKSILNQEQ